MPMHSRPRVLLLTHGREHERRNPGYRFLKRHKDYCFDHGCYVDAEQECKPDHVMDLTMNHTDAFETHFDYIFCMFTPFWVLKSKTFWYNVESWLAPGGIVQTLCPRALRMKDYSLAHRVMCQTGLRMLDKRKHMVPSKQHEKAIVMTKT